MGIMPKAKESNLYNKGSVTLNVLNQARKEDLNITKALAHLNNLRTTNAFVFNR
jgi:hypothetical protein